MNSLSLVIFILTSYASLGDNYCSGCGLPNYFLDPVKCPSGAGCLCPQHCANCLPGAYCSGSDQYRGGDNIPGFSRCTAGTFNADFGASSPSACKTCASGTNSSVGAGKCCPLGRFIPQFSLGNCSSCPMGSYCPAGATAPTLCPAGSYQPTKDQSGQSSCLLCPVGTYNSNAGSTALSACLPCPAGYFNPSSGGTSSTFCAICPAGSWSSDGAAVCRDCSIGSFNSASAQSICSLCPYNTFSASSGSKTCSSCGASTFSSFGSGVCCSLGSWSAPGSTNCTQCPAGTFNAIAGSTSPSSCSKCDIGSYSPFTGSSTCAFCPLGTTTVAAGSLRNTSCVPCAAGKYQDTLGVPCLDCLPNTFSAALGATSASTCKPCPGSGSTDAAGTPSLSLCRAFQCGPGLQPRTPTPLSPLDCTPITCPTPLSLSADGTGCAGCGLSSYGTPPACSSCPANSTCPGFFALPLSHPASLAAGSSLCTAASTISTTPVVIPNQPSSFSLASIPPLVTLCAAGGLAAAVLILLTYVAQSPSTARGRLENLLKQVDSFSMAHVVPPGSPLLNRPTALGGACSLLSLLAFLSLAVMLILQYAYANVSVQTALDTLLSSSPFTSAVPWAPPLTDLSPPIASGVQLRLFAQEGLACSSLAAGTGISSSPNGWTVVPSVSCGDGRSLLVLSCPSCAFTPTSFVQFYLPYTCQAFFLEATAVDAQGVVNSVAFPPAISVASPTALLASLSWTVDVLGTILKDATKGSTAQGYQLSAAAAAATPAPLGATLIPARATVAVAVSLPLQTYYSSTLLQPQQSLVSLLSSIVGLLGIIGLFRVLFLVSELTLSRMGQGNSSKRRQSSALPLAGRGGLEERDGAAVTGGSEHSNPLRRGALKAHTEPEAAPAAAQWKRCEEGKEVWYVNEVTGESSWTLP